VTNKDFKILFNDFALNYGFSNKFGAWFKESDECIVALILRKSNYSNLHYLRIKVDLKNMFHENSEVNKEWVKHDIADVLYEMGKNFNSLFDLENPIDDAVRTQKLELLFIEFLSPLVAKMLSINGLLDLNQKGIIFLLPIVKEGLIISKS
jgi:hypothetical protein